MFLKNKRLIIIFAISLLAHVIIIYVMARSTQLPAMAEMDVTEQPVIQARLIFELPPIAEPPEDPPPEPEQPKDPVSAPEPAKAQIIEEKSEDTVAVEAPPLAAPSPVDAEEPTTEPVEAEPFFQKSTASKESRPQNPLTNMARRHLSHFQQQQRNKMVEQASRAYQQQKNSPIIDDEVKDRFLSEDEKFRNSRAIKADCSSAGKKTAAVLLSLFGGQVDCSKPPPINSFIQNRINKTEQLPSLQHEQKKRPKSLVIEDQP